MGFLFIKVHSELIIRWLDMKVNIMSLLLSVDTEQLTVYNYWNNRWAEQYLFVNAVSRVCSFLYSFLWQW